MKNKETLEEVVKKYSEKEYSTPKPLAICIDFARLGAKWMQERMYSEEEVLKLFNDWCEFDWNQDSFSGKDDLTFNQWFEKFKKK
jgi:hypothetical protein